MNGNVMTFNSCNAKDYLKDENMNAEKWERIARELWAILDDIDTASDIFKPIKNNFYNHSMNKVGQRWMLMGSDGYKLYPVVKQPK